MPRTQRTPAGFVFLAICAALFGLAMTVALASGPFENEPQPLIYGSIALLAALSFLTAEALLFNRRWAARASVVLAGVFTVVAVLASREGVAIVITSMMFLVPALMYILGRSRQMAGTPPHARPRP